MYKLFFARYGQAVARLKETTKMGIFWPMFPGSTSIVSRYVVKQIPVPQAEVPGRVSRSFSQETGCVFQSVLCVVVACQ